MTVIHTLSSLLAEGGSGGGGGLFGSPIVMMVLLVVMFYFLLIRPQQKQRKEQAARISSMETGDKVVSAGGIHGLVHNIKERTVVVKVAEGMMIEFEKSSITTVTKKSSGESDKG
jgi:preprotein translocase subunit YajC